ncbi:MAG: energy transducer TonB [Alistipes indistinctus]
MVLLSLTSVRAADSSPDGTTVDRITFREENRFDPVVYVDGAEVKEGMQGLNPDSVLSVHISSAGILCMSPRCPEPITAAAGSRRSRRCGTQKARRYLIDWQPADKKQVKQLAPGAVKSAEYDASDGTLSILSRDRNGVVYDRNGVAFVFLYRTAPGAESSRQAADSLRSCLAYAASFAGAEFQGAGVDSFSRWVATQVIYPPTLQRFNKSGLVRVAFTVRADGSVCDFRELESSSPLFTQEVIRVMQGAPRWQPATAFGKPVDASYTVALEFNTGSSSNNYRHVLGDFRAGSLQRQFGGY